MRTNTAERKFDFVRKAYVWNGHITVPVSEEERGAYIQNCFTSRMVAVLNEDGQLYRYCLCNDDIMSHVRFPEGTYTRGDAVLGFYDPRNNMKVIQSLINFDIRRTNPKTRSILPASGGAALEMGLDEEDKGILSLSSDDEISQEAPTINLLASNRVNIRTPNGTISIQDGEIHVEGMGAELRVGKEKVEVTQGSMELVLSGEKISIKNDQESLLTLFNDVVTSLTSLTNAGGPVTSPSPSFLKLQSLPSPLRNLFN